MCEPNEPRDDSGINPLFDYHAEEGIVYPPDVKSELSKCKGIPDRVYGLRATRRLERILSSADKRRPASGQCISDTLVTHPFVGDSEPIHFPFLVLEAKSEKGSDSLTDAAYQSAFSIRQLLAIQEGLRVAAGEDADWDGGPLVWFLSNKGEEWKVCIAYIERKNDCKYFVSTRLPMNITFDH